MTLLDRIKDMFKKKEESNIIVDDIEFEDDLDIDLEEELDCWDFEEEDIEVGIVDEETRTIDDYMAQFEQLFSPKKAKWGGKYTKAFVEWMSSDNLQDMLTL